MFDPIDQQPYLHYPKEVVGAASHRSLARTLAAESITLLKNEGDILPLNSVMLSQLAIMGPHLNSTVSLCGNYYGSLPHVVSPFEGIVNVVGASRVVGLQGCSIHSTSTSGFEAAVTAAKASDYAILFVGIDQAIESEGRDRVDLTLPGAQEAFVSAISGVQPNTIVVLINGGPIDISSLKSNANIKAILEAYYPGEEGGNAIADVLFGIYCPSGRLPYTIYPQDYVNQISNLEMGMKSSFF